MYVVCVCVYMVCVCVRVCGVCVCVCLYMCAKGGGKGQRGGSWTIIILFLVWPCLNMKVEFKELTPLVYKH